MFSKKEFAVVSNLRFISMKNFMISWVEHEKKFFNLGVWLWTLDHFVLFLRDVCIKQAVATRQKCTCPHSAYCIRPYYRTYPCKCTVQQFCSLQITTRVLLSLLLNKSICFWCSFDLSRQVEEIQMSPHNICNCKENQKQYQIRPSWSLLLILH